MSSYSDSDSLPERSQEQQYAYDQSMQSWNSSTLVDSSQFNSTGDYPLQDLTPSRPASFNSTQSTIPDRPIDVAREARAEAARYAAGDQSEPIAAWETLGMGNPRANAEYQHAAFDSDRSGERPSSSSSGGVVMMASSRRGGRARQQLALQQEGSRAYARPEEAYRGGQLPAGPASFAQPPAAATATYVDQNGYAVGPPYIGTQPSGVVTYETGPQVGYRPQLPMPPQQARYAPQPPMEPERVHHGSRRGSDRHHSSGHGHGQHRSSGHGGSSRPRESRERSERPSGGRCC